MLKHSFLKGGCPYKWGGEIFARFRLTFLETAYFSSKRSTYKHIVLNKVPQLLCFAYIFMYV